MQKILRTILVALFFAATCPSLPVVAQARLAAFSPSAPVPFGTASTPALLWSASANGGLGGWTVVGVYSLFGTQAANTFLGGPTSGAPATPAFQPISSLAGTGLTSAAGVLSVTSPVASPWSFTSTALNYVSPSSGQTLSLQDKGLTTINDGWYFPCPVFFNSAVRSDGGFNTSTTANGMVLSGNSLTYAGGYETLTCSYNSAGSFIFTSLSNANTTSLMLFQNTVATRKIATFQATSGQTAALIDVTDSTGATHYFQIPMSGAATGLVAAGTGFAVGTTPGLSQVINGTTYTGGIATAYSSSAASVSGPVNAAVVTASAYNIVANVDRFEIGDATNNSITFTLPDPTNYSGPEIDITRQDTSSTNTVTVTTAGAGKTITGYTSVSAQYQVRHYVRLGTGAGWFGF